MATVSALSAAVQATTLEALRRTGSHDAIVVGSGAAGGMAAMLLAEAGLRVLVLDAGPPSSLLRGPVRQLSGRLVRRLLEPDALKFLPPRIIPRARQAVKALGRRRQPIQSRCISWDQAPHAFIDDLDCPYVTPPDRRFDWFRSRMLGGRLVVPGHGRQYYRLGPDDFAPPDVLTPAWPLQPGELDAWYALVERRLALSGTTDNIPWLPDSEIASPLTFTRPEATLRDRIVGRWPNAHPILGRYAPPLESLEAAAKTGRLQCRQGAVVREILVDGSGNVSGVSWIDHQTGSEQSSSAPLVFLCASALESTRLLMLSRSERNPQGLGGNSGVLGRYLMDHVIVGVEGFGEAQPDWPVAEQGRCLYLPRFDARESATPLSGRGYGVQVYEFPIGAGRTWFFAFAFAEMLPRPDNCVTLDLNRRDAWGIPVLHIDCTYDEAQFALARAQTQGLRELAEVGGIEITKLEEEPRAPGSAIHECGTARMGTAPANSVLDANNQCWDARGLYVTDAACFPSQGYQNPTLTILALTARACQHALKERDHRSAGIADEKVISSPA